jgi:hypothetical protein
MRILSAVCLTLLPSLGLACPTAQDLDRGIILNFESGDVEVISRKSDDVLLTIFTAHEGGTSHYLLGKGFYLLQTVDIEDGRPVPHSQINYAFPVKPSDLPTPEPNLTLTQTVIANSGGSLDTEKQDYSFGPIEARTYGACSYDAIDVKIVYDYDEYWAETVTYFPALGLSYLSVNEYDESGERKLDIFQLTSLSAK